LKICKARKAKHLSDQVEKTKLPCYIAVVTWLSNLYHGGFSTSLSAFSHKIESLVQHLNNVNKMCKSGHDSF